MSQVKVKSFVFEHKMSLTVMTLDNSKHCHLEQILFSLELSRYQGLTVFIPGILDKGKFKRKFVLILDTENITDVLEKISWFNLEAFTFENMKISLKAFINLTLFSMGVLCLPKVFPRRLISKGVNNGLLFMTNCFPYCFLEIIVGGQNQQGGHKPGKYGILREFEKLSESQGKLRENSGKCQFLK